MLLPESVSMILAFSGELKVSAEVVCKVYVAEAEVWPVNRSLFVTVPIVTELTTRKLYVNGLTQLDSEAVNDSYWPTSTIVFEGLDNVITHTSEGTTVNVPVVAEFAVSGVAAESVTSTFAASVFPARFEGIIHAKLFEVPVIPEYNCVAIIVPVIVFVIM